MSLSEPTLGAIPADTVRIARASFPKGTLALHLRDHLGTLYSDGLFADLFSPLGPTAVPPWRLALVSVLQFAEGLTDAQAAQAVRGRLDWKYALGLELTDPGFDGSVLSEFRTRLLAGGQEQELLDTLLFACQQHGWLKARGAQRTDSTHVLAAIRTLNRLETVGETLRAAVNALATVAPAWLRAWVPADWFDRYSHRVEEYRLPRSTTERQAYARTVGTAGARLLTEVYAPTAPAWLRQVPAVQVLRQVWVQQYVVIEDQFRLCTAEELPPAGSRIESPYDAEARYSTKRDVAWTGFKVHLTETCDPDSVHLITHVETTLAAVNDADMAAPIQNALIAKGLAPEEHYLDGGYVDAEFVVDSQLHQQVEVVGPVRPDVSWQARAGQGYDQSHFTVDWAGHQVTCPQGRSSRSWTEHLDTWGNEVIEVQFSRTDCRQCPVRALCTKAVGSPRGLTLRQQAEHEVLQEARRRQTTPEWQERYHRRAGIEGSLSQGVRAYELRQSRYSGLARTHLQHLLLVVAINLVRLVAWWDERAPAPTRVSRFGALVPATT